MNRHERISHFYNDYRRYAPDAVAHKLAFETTNDAMKWIAEEFCRHSLDWHKLRAGSPYPIGLPTFVRIIEESLGTTLEDQIHKKWPILTEAQRQWAFMNFERIFGHPELLQGPNESFCALKFSRWQAHFEHDKGEL